MSAYYLGIPLLDCKGQGRSITTESGVDIEQRRSNKNSASHFSDMFKALRDIMDTDV